MIIRRALGKFVRWCAKPPVVEYGALGDNSIVHTPNISDETSKNIFIGNNTTILPNSRIQLFPDRGNRNARIIIGNGCFITYNVTLLGGDDITIEDNVLIASNVLITSENHSIDPESDIPYMNQPLITAPVVIGEGSWLGEKAIILPGVTIGKKCVIGAGSVVTKSVPDYCIAAGNPAKIIKKYNFNNHQWERV